MILMWKDCNIIVMKHNDAQVYNCKAVYSKDVRKHRLYMTESVLKVEAMAHANDEQNKWVG